MRERVWLSDVQSQLTGGRQGRDGEFPLDSGHCRGDEGKKERDSTSRGNP